MPKCPSCNSWLKPGLSHDEKIFSCKDCGVSLFQKEKSYFLGKLRFFAVLFISPLIGALLDLSNIVTLLIVSPFIIISYLNISKYQSLDDGKRWGRPSYK
jgi:hypothetical protein